MSASCLPLAAEVFLFVQYFFKFLNVMPRSTSNTGATQYDFV